MSFWYLKFLVSLAFGEMIWSLPLGCPYNGTSYGEGEVVKTEEPCLSCVCRRGALQCDLRVCGDHSDVPPPGCFFLHKPNDCCPQLFCEEENFNPVQFELQTSFKLENNVNVNDCRINGSIYAEGSALASTRQCEYCYCAEGEMKCIKPRCLRSFEGCKPTYEMSSCCPTHYDCRNADSSILRTQIESFVAARTDPKDSSDSSRTLSDLETEPGEEYPGTGTTTMTTMTTAKETVPEETTTKAEIEGTTLLAEDFPTSTGIQTGKTEAFSKGPTTEDSTEESTPATEATTDLSSAAEGGSQETWDELIRTKFNFSEPSKSSVVFDEEIGNSSIQQEVEDYDSYDYGEPQLPPSLPNLVIFPFVAADAVIKDEAAAESDTRDSKIEIKRIDVHPVFYKDYFSPPEKTEGGFVPKEPPKINGPFFEQSYFGTKTDTQWTNVTFVEGSDSNLKGVTAIVDDTNSASDNIVNIASPVQKSQQTKKPVTVTYKNVVVDFYPNYLVTTTRAHPEIQVGEIPWSNKNHPTVEGTHAPAPALADKSREPSEDENSSSPPKKTRETPTGTLGKPPFLDHIFKSFLPGETTATAMSTKHKYSSKIKGSTNGANAKAGQKVVENGVASTGSFLNILVKPGGSTTSVPGKSKIYSSRKEMKKEGATEAPQEETNPEVLQLPREDVEGDAAVSEDATELCAGALLKLAGCNIYGMMYRVGKVIAELSGPCTECLCTDLGVQCRPLEC